MQVQRGIGHDNHHIEVHKLQLSMILLIIDGTGRNSTYAALLPQESRMLHSLKDRPA